MRLSSRVSRFRPADLDFHLAAGQERIAGCRLPRSVPPVLQPGMGLAAVTMRPASGLGGCDRTCCDLWKRAKPPDLVQPAVVLARTWQGRAGLLRRGTVRSIPAGLRALMIPAGTGP
jgi:hypothetical protein